MSGIRSWERWLEDPGLFKHKMTRAAKCCVIWEVPDDFPERYPAVGEEVALVGPDVTERRIVAGLPWPSRGRWCVPLEGEIESILLDALKWGADLEPEDEGWVVDVDGTGEGVALFTDGETPLKRVRTITLEPGRYRLVREATYDE